MSKDKDSKISLEAGDAGRKPSKSLFLDGTYDINNFHDVFLECEDMTEYEPALKLVGSWREWERLKRDWPAFGGFIESWKEELEVKLRSRAIKKIQDLSTGEDSKAYQAAKFIAESGYNKRAGAGRPSNSERKRAETALAKAASETEEEFTRTLAVIQGGIKSDN